MAASTQHHPDLPWFWRAIVHGITGLAFGIILSIVLVAFSGTRLIGSLERWGSDWGLWLRSNVLAVTTGYHATSKTAYAFLDVRTVACNKYRNAEHAKECDHPATLPADFLAAIIDAVDKTGPKIIIVDFPLPEETRDQGSSTEKLDRLKAVLEGTSTDPPRPPLLAPLPVRPTPRNENSFPPPVQGSTTSTFLKTLSAGRLRLAGFMTWTDTRGGDGAIRGYPAILSLENTDDEPRVPTHFPTVPYLAALVAASPSKSFSAADCLFYSKSAKTECIFSGEEQKIAKKERMKEINRRSSRCPRWSRSMKAIKRRTIWIV